ncbi:hypothetical protein FRC10_008359, partial [Ceratobasidium sp. 414]
MYIFGTVLPINLKLSAIIADMIFTWLSISAIIHGVFANKLDCPGLFDSSKTLINGLKPYVAAIHPANVTFSTPDASPAYPQPVPDLPEFCRFGAEFNTSKTSKFRFEVWLPTSEHWNGRFAFVSIIVSSRRADMVTLLRPQVGNGGDAGGVNYPIDFGHRAVHLSTTFAKTIAQAYYGQKPKYNYWIGCSSGGKQGVKSAQMYPSDFDGVVAGAPAQWWPHLNGFTMHINMLNANTTTPGAVISASLFTALNNEVISQCDRLDGVSDGILTNPRLCKPDLSRVACGSTNLSSYFSPSSCFSQPQMVTLKAIYANWTSNSGEFLFPTFEPGSESGWGFTISGNPYGPAPDYFSYQVLNKTSRYNLQINETELQRLTAIGDATDPGQTNAVNPNLRPFFDRGGKLLQYHGFADPLIPSGSSLWYYEHVRSYFKNVDISDKYRLFMVPG